MEEFDFLDQISYQITQISIHEKIKNGWKKLKQKLSPIEEIQDDVKEFDKLLKKFI